MDGQQALALVYEALEGVNAIQPPDQAIPMEPDVVLTGADGSLDSLALTTLILTLESRLRSVAGRDVPLMQDIDLDSVTRDFKTPRHIAALLVKKLDNG